MPRDILDSAYKDSTKPIESESSKSSRDILASAYRDPSQEEVKEIATDVGKKLTANPDFEYETLADKSVADNIKEAALTGLNYVIDGLDYANNVSRSIIHAGIEGKDMGEAASKAAQYKQRIYAEDLRSAVGKKYGIDLNFSKVDGEFDTGDIADFAVDFAIDVVTDPLTYVSFGVNKLIKGIGKAASKSAAVESSEQIARRITPQLEQAATNVSKKVPDTPKAKIEMGKEFGLVDDIELNDAALKAHDLAKTAGGVQAAKDAYAGTMGGIFYSAANAEEENSLQDMAKNFAIGAMAVGGGRRYVRKQPWVKERAAKIGQALNDMVGPKEKVNMVAWDATGKRMDVATDTKGWMMGDVANDAGVKSRNSYMQINNILGNARKQIVEGDAVGGATSLMYAEKFSDYITTLRNDEWKRLMKEIPDEKLKQLGIEPKLESIADSRTPNRAVKKEYPNWSSAKSEGAVKLKKVINQGIERKYFDKVTTPDGKQRNVLNRPAVQAWIGKNEGELTDKILDNMQIWKTASDDVFDLEKKLMERNFAELLTPDETMSVIMRERREAAAGLEPGAKTDLLDESDIKKAMDLRMANEGLLFWTPRVGERGLATTKLAAEKPKAYNLSPKQRQALEETINNGDRKFLAREELRAFENARTVENAVAYVNNFESLAEIAARGKAKKVLNTIQQEATSYAGSVFANQKESVAYLKRVNSLVKKGLLLGSYTWIKNNFWSNVRSAFSNSGVFGLMDQAQVFNWTSDLSKDLRKIYFAKGDKLDAFKWADDEIDEMIDLGVIESTHWKDISKRQDAEELRRYIWDDETIAKIKEKEISNKFLDKADEMADKMASFLHTRQVGGYIEAMARATTYKRTVDMLKKQSYRDLADTFGNEAALNAIKKQAVDITNDVFFDYGKLTYFERSFVRELVPFYSFYKQNLMYQGKSLLDPSKTSKLGQLARIGDGRYFGSEPLTGDQKNALPNHLRTSNSLIWTDKDGNKKIFYTTSDPAAQAYQMLSKEYWFNADFVQQLNPMIKSLVEQGFGYDAFRGEAMDPKELSNNPDSQLKYMFSRGYSMMPIYNAFAKAIGQSEGMYKDMDGNPVTDKEWVARVDNVFSWMLAQYTSTPVQVAGALEKMRHGKASGWDTAMNLGGAFSTTELIGAQQSRRLEKVMEDKYLEENEDVLEKQRRALRYVPNGD